MKNSCKLRTIIHQQGQTIRADTTPYNEEASEEFQSQEMERRQLQPQKMESQEEETLRDRHVLVCPHCATPLPEKQVNNRRKRGLTDVFCSNCRNCVSLSLLANQERPMGGLAQSGSEETRLQSIQAMLQRKIDIQAFDVFLCYNHHDKPVVKHIGEQLKQHGILPWLDEWDLRPGEPWQRALEEQIRKTKMAIVFVGSQGMGPWQGSEMYAVLRQMKMRDCRVIPVWLPGTSEHLELPLLLEEMFWVDFRLQEPDPMRQLLWGITGKK